MRAIPVLLSLAVCSAAGAEAPPHAASATLSAWRQQVHEIYRDSGLEQTLAVHVFERAMAGYTRLESQGLLPRDSLITIIDYAAPSTQRRLYVVDLRQRQLLHHSLVAHGRNSGSNLARRFSNRVGSLQSSLGFYVTGSTYHGRHGYSLRLQGLEPRINDNAIKRHIVMHAAKYVSRKHIDRYRRLGRSWGCPALPPETSQRIIDTIKGGSCLFVHANDPKYLATSQFADVESVALLPLDEGSAP